MSSVNKPEDVKHVYNIITERVELKQNMTKEEKNKLIARVVLKLREAILKSYIIIGFPKVICELSNRRLFDLLINHYKRLSIHYNN